MSAFEAITDSRVALIRVQCGDRARWRSPDNPFREQPFMIYSVPTLARWAGEASKEGALWTTSQRALYPCEAILLKGIS